MNEHSVRQRRDRVRRPSMFTDPTMVAGFDAVRAALTLSALCALMMPPFFQGLDLALITPLLWRTREPIVFLSRRGRLW